MGDTVDDATTEAITSMAGIPYEGRRVSAAEKKRKAMQDAYEWIRNNDPKVADDPDDDLMRALSRTTGRPMPEKMTPKNKKKFANDSVEWLRNNDPGRLDTVDDTTAEVLAKWVD